jgi:hypothetical protein
MKCARSLVLAIALGPALVSLLVIGIPTNGFAQVPQVCKSDLSGPQPEYLGGVKSFTFTLARACEGGYSDTTAWKWAVIRLDTHAVLCIGGPQPLPPSPVSFTCPPADEKNSSDNYMAGD